MSDIETRLADHAQRWQQSQPPPPGIDPARFAQRPHSWVPLAVAAAVVAIVAAAVAIPAGLRGGSAPASTLVASAVTATAPANCPNEVRQSKFQTSPIVLTRVPNSQLETVLAGHLPVGLPAGFGLQVVAQTPPGGGLADWVDGSCRLVHIDFAPRESSVSGPAHHVFGPWDRLGNDDVYVAAAPDGIVTVSTHGLDQVTTEKIVRSVNLAQTETPSPSPTNTPPPTTPSQRADLDGDGRADTVTVQWVKHSSTAPWSGVAQVDVAFGGGGHASYDVPIRRWIPLTSSRPLVPAFGVSQVNSIGGLEVVIVTDNASASYVDTAVLTVTADRKVRPLPPPDGDAWRTGGSVGTGALGYQCNEATLVRVTSTPVGHRYTVRSVTYRWDGTAWTQLGSPSSQTQRKSGLDRWNCYGLDPVD